MKNNIIILFIILAISSSCKQKECNDSSALNYNQKGDCLFCTTETRTVEVFDDNVNSSF